MVLSKGDLMFMIGVVSCVIMILLVFFVSLIIINVKKRKQGEIEKLNAIIAAEENERIRIAKDMHDDLGPLLSGIKLQINLLSKHSTTEQIEATQFETKAQLDNAIENIRFIVRNLMPPGLRKYGLLKCIVDFQHIVSKKNNTTFEFNHAGLKERFNENAELNLFRIIHELINNSLKHSNCSLITLNMNLVKDSLKIIYKDNGSNDNIKLNDEGMGLLNIESRINLLDGRFTKSIDFSSGANYYIEFNSSKLYP